MANGKPGRPRKQPDLSVVPETPIEDASEAFDIEVLRDCHIGFLPERAPLNPELTVDEFLTHAESTSDQFGECPQRDFRMLTSLPSRPN